jgi:hypothetical protein
VGIFVSLFSRNKSLETAEVSEEDAARADADAAL